MAMTQKPWLKLYLNYAQIPAPSEVEPVSSTSSFLLVGGLIDVSLISAG
jgi:hypothetical protein